MDKNKLIEMLVQNEEVLTIIYSKMFKKEPKPFKVTNNHHEGDLVSEER
jgi:hypothetical protein